MFDNIENLKIISSLHKDCKAYSKIENRATHSFIIRICGSVLYEFCGQSFIAKAGEMMFIPKGSTYEYHALSDTECTYTSINFLGEINDPKPTLFSLENFFEAEYIAGHFSDLWKFGNQSEKYKCYALLYDLFSYVSAIENTSYADKKKYSLIEPAVSYLNEHLYDASLKADALPRLCGISGTYFRKIFFARFGTSPQNYMIQIRLSHAKSVIDSGDYDSIREVALSVGYNDPLYFGKAFKNFYGVSPSEANKKML